MRNNTKYRLQNNNFINQRAIFLFFCKMIIAFVFVVSNSNAQAHLWDLAWDISNNWSSSVIFRGEIVDSMNAVVTYQTMDPDSGYQTCAAITSDGGKTFKKIYQSDGSITPICATNPKEDVYYLGCEFVSLMKSNDGGKNWEVIKLQGSGYQQVNQISMFDELHGIALLFTIEGIKNLQYIYATDDGWVTWRKLEIPAAPLIMGRERDYDSYHYFLKCLSPSTYLCNFYYSKIIDSVNYIDDALGRTTDGGKTWTFNKNTIPYELPRLSKTRLNNKFSYSIPKFYSFKDSLVGWAMTNYLDTAQTGSRRITNYISKTTDGGATWKELRKNSIVEPKDGLLQSYFPSIPFCMYDDYNGVLLATIPIRTSDGGRTWERDSVKDIAWTQVTGSYQFERRGNAPIFLKINKLNKLIRDVGTIITSVKKDEDNEKGRNEIETLDNNGEIKFRINKYNLSKSKIQFFDLLGNEMRVKAAMSSNEINIKKDNFQNGIYFVKLQIETKVFTGKFIIKN